MIDLDIDSIDIQKFQAKMRQYPVRLSREFSYLISGMTKMGEREVANAVRSGPTRAFDKGNLFRNISSRMKDPLVGEIRSSAPYSLYVHSGTKYMRARPFMQRGLENSKNQFNNLIRSFLNRALK